tara:strand:- start:1217 stop:1570 length:354 start_codon:yes stop_codon:yes gene_type:complete
MVVPFVLPIEVAVARNACRENDRAFDYIQLNAEFYNALVSTHNINSHMQNHPLFGAWAAAIYLAVAVHLTTFEKRSIISVMAYDSIHDEGADFSELHERATRELHKRKRKREYLEEE